MKHKIEILAPLGQLRNLNQLLSLNIDSLYVGLKNHSARPNKFCLTVDEIKHVKRFSERKKVYVAINNPVMQCFLEEILFSIKELQSVCIDAFIISDLGLVNLLRSMEWFETPIHLSCLCGVWNSYAASFMEKIGVARIVLPTNLGKNDVKHIVRNTNIEIELIASGGVCLFDCYRCSLQHYIKNSNFTTQCSECFEIIADNNLYLYKKNHTDVCIGIKWAKEAGIGCLKIEGRTRSVFSIENSIKELTECSSDITIYDSVDCNIITDKNFKKIKTVFECNMNSESRFSSLINTLDKSDVDLNNIELILYPLNDCLQDVELHNKVSGIVLSDVVKSFDKIDIPANISVHWQTPLYANDKSFDNILHKIDEVAKRYALRTIRLHDIGLLSAIQVINSNCTKIVWDRFAWPARIPMPLSLQENFLREYGVDYFEYGLDQSFQVNETPIQDYTILMLPGKLKALIPPALNFPRTKQLTVAFDNKKQLNIVNELLLDRAFYNSVIISTEVLKNAKSIVLAVEGSGDIALLNNWLNTQLSGFN